MKYLSLVFLLLAAPLLGAADTPAGPAATNGAAQAIEHNLSYRRVHTLPDDLPALSGPATGTLVLDLRFVPASPEAAAAFSAWLKSRARPQAPVLVLVNPGTAPALLAPLAPAGVPPGVVSIGPEMSDAVPDVGLTLAAGADRAAYDAFEHGTSLADLISPRIDKVRHDEAAMARERAAGAAAATDTGDDGAVPPDEKPSTPPPATAPVAPVDRVLQRAVQLHHALQALKKI
jgi:hypothetical protein